MIAAPANRRQSVISSRHRQANNLSVRLYQNNFISKVVPIFISILFYLKLTILLFRLASGQSDRSRIITLLFVVKVIIQSFVIQLHYTWQPTPIMQKHTTHLNLITIFPRAIISHYQIPSISTPGRSLSLSTISIFQDRPLNVFVRLLNGNGCSFVCGQCHDSGRWFGTHWWFVRKMLLCGIFPRGGHLKPHQILSSSRAWVFIRSVCTLLPWVNGPTPWKPPCYFLQSDSIRTFCIFITELNHLNFHFESVCIKGNGTYRIKSFFIIANHARIFLYYKHYRILLNSQPHNMNRLSFESSFRW